MNDHIKESMRVWREVIDDPSIFIAPDIPQNKLINATLKYAQGVPADQVLVLVDETLFGSAKNGCLLTKDAFYGHLNGDYSNIQLDEPVEVVHEKKKIYVGSALFYKFIKISNLCVEQLSIVMAEIISWKVEIVDKDFPKNCSTCGAPTKQSVRECEYCGSKW